MPSPSKRKPDHTPFVIIQDTREQAPLAFPPGVEVEVATLQSGDYSVKGYEPFLAVERKSHEDLVNTVIHSRERFEAELERLARYDAALLLIVAPFAAVKAGLPNRPLVNPRAVLASVFAFNARYRIEVMFAASAIEAAEICRAWLYYHAREIRSRLPARLR